MAPAVGDTAFMTAIATEEAWMRNWEIPYSRNNTMQWGTDKQNTRINEEDWLRQFLK